MNAENSLFPKSVKWPLWPLIPLLSFMELTGCETVPMDSTLVLRDGVLYVCVDATQKDRCYKVEPNKALPNGDKTPE